MNGRGDEAMKIADGVVSTVEVTGVPASICSALLAKGKALATDDLSAALAAYERAIVIAHQSGTGFGR